MLDVVQCGGDRGLGGFYVFGIEREFTGLEVNEEGSGGGVYWGADFAILEAGNGLLDLATVSNAYRVLAGGEHLDLGSCDTCFFGGFGEGFAFGEGGVDFRFCVGSSSVGGVGFFFVGEGFDDGFFYFIEFLLGSVFAIGNTEEVVAFGGIDRGADVGGADGTKDAAYELALWC